VREMTSADLRFHEKYLGKGDEKGLSRKKKGPPLHQKQRLGGTKRGERELEREIGKGNRLLAEGAKRWESSYRDLPASP